jgi:hypothetical protein
MFKPLIAAALIATFVAPAALAGPAERLGRIDHRLTAAELRGDGAGIVDLGGRGHGSFQE